MKYYPIKLFTAFTGILLIAASCKKFVGIDPPVSQIEGKAVFSNEKAATSAVTGVYASMVQSALYIGSGGVTLYPALSADELRYTSSNTELLSFQNNAIVADNGTGIYTRLWVPAYQAIYSANAVLEGVQSSTALSDTTKRRLRGEMLTVRAFLYFNLVNLFGDVPLLLTTDVDANSREPRTATAKIYEQLISDLTEAQHILPATSVSTLAARPNKWAAKALLSKVYLYTGDWRNAAAVAGEIIDSKSYQLETPANTFLYTSRETIWQLASDTRNTSEGANFIPSSSTARPTYAIGPGLLAALGNNDQRKSTWMKKNTNAGTDYYYPYKYKSRTSSPIAEFEIIYRLGELYLIRAEARARLNDVAGCKADLDVIRQRAGLSPVTLTDMSAAISAIESERQVELFCEWGNRFFDLKRTGRADAVLGASKAPGWQPTDALYPIPLAELQNDPALVQNPGY